MDNILEDKSGGLDQMSEDLKIFPFQDTKGGNRIFLARFEFPKHEEDFKFLDAGSEESNGFIDFLAGFPMDCIEMLVAIGEFSSKAQKDKESKVFVDPGEKVFPKVPSDGLFKWPEKSKILLNLTAIPTAHVAKILAKNLEGEPKPVTPKWWFRVQILDDAYIDSEAEPAKFPVPGEFLGLGTRIWPGKYWGHQKSNPFIFAGNWMDTVYYSCGRILEVIEPTEDAPFMTYKIAWHGKGGGDSEEEIIAMSSDFTEYRVGDRVTILKNVATEKKTQLWKDDDMKFFGGEEEMNPADVVWQIVPITFYGLETEGE
jgi:hypothetical protein